MARHELLGRYDCLAMVAHCIIPGSTPIYSSLHSHLLTPVFRRLCRTNAASFFSPPPVPFLMAAASRHPNAVPRLLPHGLGCPALHWCIGAGNGCILGLCFAVRIRFGRPGAVEGLVGSDRLIFIVSSHVCGGLVERQALKFIVFEPEPGPEPFC